MSFRSYLKVLGLMLIIAALSRCAQPGTPGGGPKDTSPPIVLGTSPRNGSPNFEGEKFTIYFDEFVELDNVTQKAMISPPTDKLPDFKLKGKTLHVKFNEELKENTTYSVYFGDAIVDLTEKNPLLNYTYIFSTGATVDSMSLKGQVINAFDLVPVEEVFVMLYKDDNDTLPLDSLPLAIKPFYLSKTDVNGQFQLNGLANEKYLMFAITDLNNNFFYDQPGENIAFLDSMITPEYIAPPKIDTTILDSLVTVYQDLAPDSIEKIIDSIYLDSIFANQKQLSKQLLVLFDEIDTTQQFIKAEMLRKNSIRFSFTQPINNVLINPINFNPDTLWYEEEFSKNRDTLIWYLKTLPVDTLEMVFLYRGDTLGHEFIRLDPKRALPGGETRKQKKENNEKKEYLGFTTNIAKGVLPLNKQPEFTFNHPIYSTYRDSTLFVSGEDSTYNPEFYFIDSLKRKVVIPMKPQESMTYSISLPDSAFIDWNGFFNEKKKLSFKTLSLRDYGILSLQIEPELKQSYIIQLLTDKEVLVQEYYFVNDTTLHLEYLTPGKYMLKLIFDDNGNQKWDPGNYSEKRQPEKVFYNPKELVIRGNWEIEEVWEIED